MTPEQREELKQAALAAKGWNWNATQGDQFGREEDGSFYDIGTVDADQYSQGGEGEDDYNGTVLRFIAKADPSAILSLIAQVEALTVPKWISVEDQLPDIKVGVLISDGTVIASAELDNWCGEDWWTGHGFGGHEWDFDFKPSKVTHWMPLPGAPTIPAIPGTKEGA